MVRERTISQRVRYLTEDEITRLLEACEEKPHLHRIVVCAVPTGMRRGEILSLKWSQIRNGFIYLEETKTKERRVIPVIPMNETLSKALKEIRKEQGLTSKYVFTYAGRSFSRVDRAFHGALTRAKIEDFRFHDLRHYAESLTMPSDLISPLITNDSLMISSA